MIYNFVRAIARVLFYFLGLKHEGLHNIPKEGALIIASNHLSYYDPFVIALLLDRPVHFMAKSEFFENKLLGQFLTALNAFPVKRGSADKRAIKEALKILKQGNILGIFPEGTRKNLGTEVNALTGTALLSMKTDTPVVPVACIGTKRHLPNGGVIPLMVIFGEPIKYDKDKDKINSKILEAFSQEIANEINLILINKEGFKAQNTNCYDR